MDANMTTKKPKSRTPGLMKSIGPLTKAPPPANTRKDEGVRKSLYWNK